RGDPLGGGGTLGEGTTMNSIKALLIVAFVMVLAAGFWMGRSIGQTEPEEDRPTWLAEELNLSSQQEEAMRETWSEVREKMGDYPGEERRTLSDKRDEAIKDLLTEEQYPLYQEIQEKYRKEREDLIENWKAPYEEAMERTRQILSEEQFIQFEELKAKRHKHD
ncbi:MAG: hypothetical protein KC964_20610, partial [Candidatus Omnitrophica bacterium]|nr:hypothetical protein [Candidatus Omnitrophota bacterium]